MNRFQTLVHNLYEKLLRYAKPQQLLLGFLLILLFNLIFLPLFPRLYNLDIPVNKVLDLKFSYRTKEVYSFFEELGEKGRKVYLLSESLVDTTYMLTYSLFYATLFVFLIERKKLYHYRFLVLFPFGIAFWDLLENLGIIFLLKNYPERSEFLVSLTSTFSSLKWMGVFITFMSLLGILFMRTKNE